MNPQSTVFIGLADERTSATLHQALTAAVTFIRTNRIGLPDRSTVAVDGARDYVPSIRNFDPLPG
jgi:hypothetical protein